MRSNNDLRTTIPMLLILLPTILMSPVVNGFVPPSASSPLLSTFATPFPKTAKIHVSTSIGETAGSESDTEVDKSTTYFGKVKKATRNPLKQAYRIYTGYAEKLWRETGPSERSKIANDKVAQTVREMQHVLTSEHETISSSSNSSGDEKRIEASENLLKACQQMLSTLEGNGESEAKMTEASTAVASIDTNGAKSKAPPAKKEKKQRSILFGAIMGAVVAAWVFSGNYIFTGLFCLMTILGQLEYYRMIMNTGVFPARRISVLGATSMFLTVCLVTSRCNSAKYSCSSFQLLCL